MADTHFDMISDLFYKINEKIFNKALILEFYRAKIYKISGNQLEFCSAIPIIEGVGAALAVNMTVNAESNLVFFKQLKDFLASVMLINRGIMEKDQLLFVPCRFEGSLKAHYFTVHDFLVMLYALFLLIKPAPGAAYGIIIIKEAVIVKYFYGIYAVLGEKGFCF